MATKVGIVGVGIMGRGMSRNLLKAGFEVHAYDIRKEALDVISADGAHPASSSREVGERADVVILMVVNYPQIRSVLLGDNGLLKGMRAGGTVIVMSTIAPREIKEVAAEVSKWDVRLLDAPVTGGKLRAEDGTMNIMVGGARELYKKWEAVFKAMGNPYHVGDVGMGQSMKMINQLVVGCAYGSMVEALILAERVGLNLEDVINIVGGGWAGSQLFRFNAPKILKREFSPASATMELLVKDVGIVVDGGREFNVPLNLVNAAYQLFVAARNYAPDDEDAISIIKVLERATGLEVKG